MPLCVGSGSQPKDGAVRCMRRLQIAQQCRVLALSLQVSEGEVFAGSLGVVCLLLMLFNFGGGDRVSCDPADLKLNTHPSHVLDF